MSSVEPKALGGNTAEIGKSELYDMYWRKAMAMSEIADVTGLSPWDICSLMERLGVPSREGTQSVDSYVLHRRPREWLFNEYWREDKSTVKIASENGVNNGTVRRTMLNHEPPIRLRDKSYYSGRRSSGYDEQPKRTFSSGYIQYHVGLGSDGERVREHRLTAIGEWGLESVEGKHVHHTNGIKWLNVPEFDIDIPELENPNLVPVDPITHAKMDPR